MQVFGALTAALTGLTMQRSQEREEFRYVPVTPGFPLLSNGTRKRFGERAKHLIHVGCNHLRLNLFPMFQALHLRADAVQFVGPSEKVCGKHALAAVGHRRRKILSILFFQKGDLLSLRLEVRLRRRHRHIGQSHHAAALGRTLDGLWPQVFTRPAEAQAPDVDEDLYGGFVGNADRRRLTQLRALDPAALARARTGFDDPRLAELLLRWRARNHPDTLTPDEAAQWQQHREAVLLAGEGGARTLAQLQEVPLVARWRAEVLAEYPALAAQPSRRLLSETLRRLLSAQVVDLVATTAAAVAEVAPADVDALRHLPALAALSPAQRRANAELKRFLFSELYRHPQVAETTARARSAVVDLFGAYLAAPQEMPEDYAGAADLPRSVADYIAGMTDRYSTKEYRRLFAVGEM